MTFSTIKLLHVILALAVSGTFAKRSSTVKFNATRRPLSVKTGAGIITLNSTFGADNKTVTGLDLHVNLNGFDTKTYGTSFTYFIATYGISANNCTWPGAAMPGGDISATAGPLVADAAGNIAPRVDHIPKIGVMDVQGQAIVIMDSKGQRVACSNIGSPKKQNPAYLALHPNAGQAGAAHTGTPSVGREAAAVTGGAQTGHSFNIMATIVSLIVVACVSSGFF
ncbi:hypothetical protein SeMB42_g00810 [Synchytrium endobioticum]|uniref:Superoxide dismutase copper/zinc binding domain-containing protein n=1 Tax=Synchytrium endobioticum TaxID=286115 RepID=A0A507DJK9_9FUNG|nr:hypothetical protein SeLEV6574_g00018 [Synchytrium endobioticum]TPX53400.1 hypothetical protein SeMB42_g00810 [Synchytrium endobioticum]